MDDPSTDTPATSALAEVRLKPRKARPFFAGHPWLYEGSIDRVAGRAYVGDEVRVVSHEGTFVARGVWNPSSSIRVRLLRRADQPLDREFWSARIHDACQLRERLLEANHELQAYRLISSEADGLSGLTVDRYDRWLVAQWTSKALAAHADAILPLLLERSRCEGLISRFDGHFAGLEGFTEAEPDRELGQLPDGPITIHENGLEFQVDLRSGQKTGFYLDQRLNRRAVAAFSGGREVLDLYCYTGGFAINAVKNGPATWAMGIDSSAPAIERARANAVANRLQNVRFEQGDVMQTLASIRSSGRTFGVVVCDPPKFVANSRSLDDGLTAYVRLNRAAVEVLEPGGILASCSCSGLVDRGMFAGILARVGELSNRTIQILEQRGQPPDHPVAVACPESEYLKCFICRVL